MSTGRFPLFTHFGEFGYRLMTQQPPSSGSWTARLAILIAFTATASAANFDLATTIRAGRPGNAAWEIGIGPITNSGAVRGHVNNPNYYPNALPNRFEIGYTSATNSAYLRYYYSATNYRQVVYAPGGPGLGGYSLWTIPAGSLFVTATRRPVRTAVTISNLTLAGGVQVLQPFSSTTMTATQLRSNSTVSSTTPVVFRTNSSGNWLLSGTITFTGLLAYVQNGASGAQLRMGAGISGVSTPTPEPHVFGLTLAGFVLIAGLKLRSRKSPGAA